MKTYKDLFLDQSADVYDTPRRIIKASLRMAAAGRNEENLSASDQSRSAQAADKRTGNLRYDIRPAGTRPDRAGSLSS